MLRGSSGEKIRTEMAQGARSANGKLMGDWTVQVGERVVDKVSSREMLLLKDCSEKSRICRIVVIDVRQGGHGVGNRIC